MTGWLNSQTTRRPPGRVTRRNSRSAAFRKVYTEYLMRSLPAIARRVSSNPESYVYLAESIQAWPTQRELASALLGAGWSEVAWRNLTGGIVALHRAVKPGGPVLVGDAGAVRSA